MLHSVAGQAGTLGERQSTATVAEQADGSGLRWVGPLRFSHFGFCSAERPEEKTGELRLTLSDSKGEATATLLLDGTACSFRGRIKDVYDGIMQCPNRRDVPMILSIH
jgi:hypothetical protein